MTQDALSKSQASSLGHLSRCNVDHQPQLSWSSCTYEGGNTTFLSKAAEKDEYI